MLKKLKWRLFLVSLSLVLPFWYVGIAVKELWDDESLFEVYGSWWKSFKKGEKL